MCIKATSPTPQDISPTEPGLELKVFTKEDVSSKPKKRTFFFQKVFAKEDVSSKPSYIFSFWKAAQPGSGKTGQNSLLWGRRCVFNVLLASAWAPAGPV